MLENRVIRPVYATRTLSTLVEQFSIFTSLLDKDCDQDTRKFQLNSNAPVLKEFELTTQGIRLGYGPILGSKASSLIDAFADKLIAEAKVLADTTGDLEDPIYSAKQEVLKEYTKLVDHFRQLDNLY